jgi:signal transduction histidine kinase
VDDTLTLLGERFGREVEVCFERGENLPPVFVARDLVQQILLNFIFNAAESMAEQKRIIITTREMASPPSGIILAPSSGKNFVAVAVKDFGCGIPPENLPRIFEPFFTTKALSTRRGTGLGLSMVYELAKKLGAGISVESTSGKGSEFTLILPVSQKLAEAKREKELIV